MKWIPLIVSGILLTHSTGGWAANAVPTAPVTQSGKPALTWQVVENLLQDHSRVLAISTLNVQLSRAGVQEAHTGLTPQLSAGVSGTVSKSNSDSAATGAGASLSISQVLWDGGKLGVGIANAESRFAASEAVAIQAAANDYAHVRNQFYQLWYSQALLRLNKTIVDRRADQYELLKYRYASGLEHEGALMTSKANWIDAQTAFTQSERTVALNRLTLAQSVSGDLSGFSDDATMADSVPVVVPSENHYILVDRLPAVREATAQLAVAKGNLTAAQLQLLPAVSAGGSASKSLTFSPTSAQSDNLSAQVGINYSIWDGGAIGIAQKSAELRVASAELALEQARTTALLSLEVARENWRSAVENLVVQTQFWNANVSRANIAGLQYKSGRLSFNEWILIENNLVQSQKSVLRAQLDVWVAESEWRHVKGESLDTN